MKKIIILLAMMLLLTGVVNAIPVTNCMEITAPGEYVLQNDIIDEWMPGSTNTCFYIHHADDVTLDCAGHIIDGYSTAASNGVLATDAARFTLKNCKIQQFGQAITLTRVTDSDIINNEASFDWFSSWTRGITFNTGSNSNNIIQNTFSSFYRGIQMQNCVNNNFIENTVQSSYEKGIWALYDSTGHTFTNNEICGSAVTDIEISTDSSASGSSNKCTSTVNYNDAGYPGCQYSCPVVTDRDGDGVPDDVDDCIDIPGTAQFNGCTAATNVNAYVHFVGPGAEPGLSLNPMSGVELRVFDETDPCVTGFTYGLSWKSWPDIFATCTPIVSRVTGGSGDLYLGAMPGKYLLLGLYDGTYVGSHFEIPSDGVVADTKIQLIVKVDGSKMPGKTTKKSGSEILIIEPLYVEWDSVTEDYPFILMSSDSWGVDVSLSPPEGYESNFDSLTTQTPEYKAVQFTITEVGSVPDNVGVHMKLRGPNGRSQVHRSSIGTRLSANLAKAKGVALDKNGVVIGRGKAKGHLTGAAVTDFGEGSIALLILIISALTLVGVGILLKKK